MSSMPNQQSEKVRIALAGIAAVAALAAFITLRSIKAAQDLAGKPLVGGDLQSLASYLTPLPDSGSLAQDRPITMVVARDPFLLTGTAGASASRGRGNGAGSRSKAGEGQWVVSSILLEGARRSAIVNNVWVNVGDTVGSGAKVTAIEPDHIVVTDANGVRHTVSLQGGE
jgi:hypothetical protein